MTVKKILSYLFTAAVLLTSSVIPSGADETDSSVPDIRFFRDAAHTAEIEKNDIKAGDTVYYSLYPCDGTACSVLTTNAESCMCDYGVEGYYYFVTDHFVSSMDGASLEFSVSTCKAGDVDRDGEITPKDVFAILKASMGDTQTYWKIRSNPGADAFSDGKINLKDATMIMKHLAGWDVRLCGGEAKMFDVLPNYQFDLIGECEDTIFTCDVAGYDALIATLEANGISVPEWLAERYTAYSQVRVVAIEDAKDPADFTLKYHGDGSAWFETIYERGDKSATVYAIVGIY